MSEYKQFLQEREQIDRLVEKGYKIKSIVENLSGATVVFENGENRESLKVLSPDGRKYFSVLLIKQQKEPVE